MFQIKYTVFIIERISQKLLEYVKGECEITKIN